MSEVTVTLTVAEARQFIDDLRRLDAHVIAESGGGIRPSRRRAVVRDKLRAALGPIPAENQEAQR